MIETFFVGIVVVIPILFTVYAFLKRRVWTFALGIVAFVISQIVLRIPLLQLLNESATFKVWAITNPLLYVLFLALTAGLFEEGARWILMRYMLREKSFANGFTFGLGHGGIEALLLVGLPAISTGLYRLADTQLLAGGVERLLAMAVHVCFSLIVIVAVRTGKIRYVGLAVLLHGAINLVGGYLAMSQSVLIVESALFIFTCLYILLTIRIVKGNGKHEKNQLIIM